VGDPSGRSKTRPPLSKEQIQENAKTYFQQVFNILDKDKTEVRFNSEWLSKITFEELFRLCSNFTIARILERDDFLNRFKNDIPIFFHELFYPIMQAYDSYSIEADIELGGTDQKFNLIMGRRLQESKGMLPQIAIIMPLLRGTDGEQKMSKSLENYIGISENPQEMFGKVMSIPDALIPEYYDLVLDKEPEEVEAVKKLINDSKENPMKLKMDLAKGIVELFHSREEAIKAEKNFVRIFSKRELPEEAAEIDISEIISCGVVDVIKLMIHLKLAPSNSEAKRLISQGAVKINNNKIEDYRKPIEVKNGDILRVGKRNFIKLLRKK
jgi:tyrosyl-tRNA synthetase